VKKFIKLQLIFLVFSFNCFALTPKVVITEDSALFRVKDSIFFLSDVKDQISEIKLFKCVLPDSLLLTTMRLDNYDYTKIKLDENSTSARDFIKQLSSLEILFGFVEKQGVFLSKEFIEKLSLKKCEAPSIDNWSKYFGNLIKSESFLQERFLLGKLKKGQVLDGKTKTDAKESAQSFLVTLKKQITVQYYQQ